MDISPSKTQYNHTILPAYFSPSPFIGNFTLIQIASTRSEVTSEVTNAAAA
jgi:hypothetical protein